MHDPLVVAFEIPRPWPKWDRSYDAKPGKPRWKARYQWATWRKPWTGWMKFWTVAGRGIYWPAMITVWHREPGGRDSGEVCKHYTRNKWNQDARFWTVKANNRWRWHVHHWRIQVIPIRKIRRFLFERCIACGRRYPYGYAPFSHQWDEPLGKWFRVSRRAYHYECSSLVTLRRLVEQDRDVARWLIGELCLRSGYGELEMLKTLVDVNTPPVSAPDFYLRDRLMTLMNYERDDDYNLVKREAETSATSND